MLYERRAVVVEITTAHDESLIRPATMRRRCIASSRKRVAAAGRWSLSRRRPIPGPGRTVISMRATFVHRLADAIDAAGAERHDARNLLDFQQLSRPSQALTHGAHGWHNRLPRTTETRAATRPAALAAPATRAAA